MNKEAVETLFDEFASRYVRGERPDVGEYLERAGGEREELGRMFDRFLQAVPAREPSEEDVVLMQARLEAEPPLLVLRLRRKLSRAAVVDALTQALGLDPAKSDKVGRYYHELEVGNLDPEPVDRRVWEVLGDVLTANVRALAGVRPAPPAAEPAFRAADWSLRLDQLAVPPVQPAEEPDEIDKLFTAGA